MRPRTVIGIAALALILGGPVLVACSGAVKFNGNWRTADRSPTGIAPDPKEVQEAVVQVYAARAFNWRGAFAVHTWVATKARNAPQYRVHHVLGWRRYDDLPVVESESDFPDRSWYGQAPVILTDVRGPEAEAVIADIETAVASYPYAGEYRLWPGPNSNTFVGWIARHVPALGLDLPPTAIGKDYLGAKLVAAAPSGTGYQVSLFGLLGVTLARVEGLEINVLGVCFGLNPLRPQLRLPGIGIIGHG
ncbi:MAG: DUF3750 domain-containing protein [Gammaproteobacteria bacterium]|nr:DUF3750 domain-containing protein [Gammaproteobacteria bacterium]